MTIPEAVGALEADLGTLEKIATTIKVSWHAVYSWKKGLRTPGRIHRGQLAELAERRSLPPKVAKAFRDDSSSAAAAS